LTNVKGFLVGKEKAMDEKNLYHHVTGSDQVRNGRGILHTIVLNGLTTAGDCTIHDSADNSGPVIGVLHLDPTTSISVQPITLTYDVEFQDGLYLDFDGTLAADLTVTFR